MNTKHIIRWSGLATLVAGISFAVVGLLHPLNEVAAITTARWTLVHLLAIAMSVFGFFGMVGLHARQAEQAGWLGLAWLGFTLLAERREPAGQPAAWTGSPRSFEQSPTQQQGNA